MALHHCPCLVRLIRLIAGALLATAMAYIPPAAAGFTVYCTNGPARRCDTFAEFIQFVTALESGRLEWVEADADMPAANIYHGDVFDLTFRAGLLPTQIDAGTPFGEILHQQVHRFLAGIQERNLFLGLQDKPSAFMALEAQTLERWKVLDAGYHERPWMEPVGKSAKLERDIMQRRDTDGPPPRQNGFDFGLTTVIPRMFSGARRLALGQPALPMERIDDPVDPNLLHLLQHHTPVPQPQVDPWQAGLHLYEQTQGLPQSPWPGAGDPFAESQYGAPRVPWAAPPLVRLPWWKRPFTFVLRSLRP